MEAESVLLWSVECFVVPMCNVMGIKDVLDSVGPGNLVMGGTDPLVAVESGVVVTGAVDALVVESAKVKQYIK